MHLEVVTKDIDCVHENIAELIWFTLIQQEYDSLALSQVLVYSKPLYFFFRLSIVIKE